MRNARVTTMRVLVALPCVAVVLILAAFALASGTPSRTKVLAALEQRATANSSPRHVAIVRAGALRLVLSVGPNRASVANAMSLRISDRGRALTGARVTVGFSMPAMNMWHAYTTRTVPGAGGRYDANVPILGMTGTWRLRVHVQRPGTRAVTVNFDDPMGT